MVALAVDGADVVSASRYMRGGRQIGGPPLKRLMSRTAGLTLHWFAGVPTHDPTNNFKLYSRRFLDTVTIESTAGFELALELTVKATIARRRVAEVPTTWRDRTAGESNFKLRKWLPHYLHWYWVAFASSARSSSWTLSRPRTGSDAAPAGAGHGSACPPGSSPSTCCGSPGPTSSASTRCLYQRAASTWLAGGDPWEVDRGRASTSPPGPAHAADLRADQRPAAERRPSRSGSIARARSHRSGCVRRLDVPHLVARCSRRSSIRSGTATRRRLALALLVSAGRPRRRSRSLIKLYAAVPLLWRPTLADRRPASVLVATLPFLPWQLYLADGPGRLEPPPGTAWNGERLAVPDACCCRRRCSGCGSCGATAPNGWPSRRSGPRPSSTTWRWRSRWRSSDRSLAAVLALPRAAADPDRGDGHGRRSRSGRGRRPVTPLAQTSTDPGPP